MECPNDNDVRAATDGPVGFGSIHEMQTDVQTANIEERLRQDRQRTERLLAEDELSTAAATTSTPLVTPLTKGDQSLARVISKRALKFLGLGKKGQDEVWQAFDDARKLVNGTNQITATFWMNFQNSMNKWFVNSRADMIAFIDRFANVAGRLAYQNPMAQAFMQMIPKIRGMNQIFIRRHQQLSREFAHYRSLNGRSPVDIMEAGGRYLNCLHAPERNEHLLNNWRNTVKVDAAEIAQLEARVDSLKPAEIDKLGHLKREVTRLTKRIDALEENLGNPNPPASLVSGGYTNGQAAAEMALLEKEFNMSRADFEGIARRISDEFDYITEELAKAGVIPPEQLAAIPDFQWYAPQLSRQMNLEAVANDATHYVPGSRHAMEGMTGTPDSAFSSLGFAARRAATEIGMQDFGLQLAALERKFARTKDMQPDWEAPILSFNDNQLSGIIAHGSRKKQAVALAIRQNNGMVVNVPVTGKDGTRSFERRYYWFNPEFVDGKLTGPALNEALSSNYKLGSKAVELMSKATSYYGQGFTRFSPGFAPIAAIRDMGERLMHIANRDYYSADGTPIAGSSLLGRYTGNIPKASSMLAEVMSATALKREIDPDSYTAKMWDEYNRWGLMQKFTPGERQEPKGLDRLLGRGGTQLTEDMRAWGLGKAAGKLEGGKHLEVANRVLTESSIAGKTALRVIDGWNDWCQNIPSFAHYITLREAGLAPREAAYGVREIMDMSQSGTLVHQYLSVVAPFVRPTMQGAAAFAKTMGLSGRNLQEIMQSGKKGWITGLAASMAFSILYPLARASMGTDADGNSYFDSLPISRATNFIPIGIDNDGGYLKIPNGFGPVRVAAALALVMDRVSRGLIDPAEGAAEVLFAAARDTVPGNNPMYNFGDRPAEFIMNYFCPAPLKPLLELATNTNAFGGNIQNADRNSDKAMADQGFKTTPSVWHRVAREILNRTGADFTPEAYQHTAKALAFGPLRMIVSGIVDFMEEGEARKGMHKPTAMEEMGPVLAAIGGTLWYGKLRDISQHYYYQAADELMAKARRAGVDMKQDGKQGAEGDAIVREKLMRAGLDAADVDDIMRLRVARKLLIGYGAEFNRNHPHWADEEDMTALKQGFEELAIKSEAVYKEFVQNANYFSRRK